MAGNFILKSVSPSDLALATRYPHLKWSDAAHKKGTAVGDGTFFQGWTPETRETLRKALALTAIDDRRLLPPHRYLEIGAWVTLNADEQSYLKVAGWAENLVYPVVQGLGLKAIPATARPKWDQGQKNEALIETLKIGPASIEVYYHGGLEIS